MGKNGDKLFESVLLQTELEKLLADNVVCYFVLEKTPKKSVEFYNFFFNIEGYIGIVVSSRSKEQLQEYGLPIPNIALHIALKHIKNNQGAVEIEPENVKTILDLIVDFLERHKDRGVVIFLDSIERMIELRGFEMVAKILSILQDALLSSKRDRKLIIALPRKTIKAKHLTILEDILPASVTFDFEK